MRRWLGYGLLGLVAYGFFLLLLFPAHFAWSFAAEPLRQQLPEVQVAGVNGRLWQGEVASVRYNTRQIGGLKWRLKPLSLLSGKLGLPISLQLPQGYLQADLTLPLDRTALHVTELKGQVPLAHLQTLFPHYPVTVGGTLVFDVNEMSVTADGRPQALRGRVNWLGASLVAPQALAFGDLQADLELDGKGAIQAKLSDLGGPMALDALFILQPQGNYTISGTVAAADGASDALRQALGWLGKPDRNGRYRFDWKGRL